MKYSNFFLSFILIFILFLNAWIRDNTSELMAHTENALNGFSTRSFNRGLNQSGEYTSTQPRPFSLWITQEGWNSMQHYEPLEYLFKSLLDWYSLSHSLSLSLPLHIYPLHFKCIDIYIYTTLFIQCIPFCRYRLAWCRTSVDRIRFIRQLKFNKRKYLPN